MKTQFLFTKINILISKYKMDTLCGTYHFGEKNSTLPFLANRCSPLQCGIIHILFTKHEKIRMGGRTLKIISLNHKWNQDLLSLHP